MQKELIICVVLIALIIAGDYFSQNYTKKTVEGLTQELEVLKQNLKDEDGEKATYQAEKIKEKWEDVYDKLAYYIEHDELEKVETAFTVCKSLTETGNYDLAISELEKTVFVLEHITDKYSFNLDNIF